MRVKCSTAIDIFSFSNEESHPEFPLTAIFVCACVCEESDGIFMKSLSNYEEYIYLLIERDRLGWYLCQN